MRAVVATKAPTKSIASRSSGVSTRVRSTNSSNTSFFAAGLNFPTIFGRNGERNQVSLYDQLGNDGMYFPECLPFLTPSLRIQADLRDYGVRVWN